MRKISMFLICSTLLAVPAFAEDCPEDKKYISAKEDCYTIARTTNNAEVTARFQPCDGGQKPPHSIKTGWQYYPDGLYCVNACKQGDDYVCCVCGVYTCEDDYERNSWATECVKKQGVQAPAEATEEPVAESTGGVENPEVPREGDNQTSDYPLATDAEGNVNVIADNNVQCHQEVIRLVAHARVGDWRSDANGAYTCKDSDGNNMRCKCYITGCDDNYEAAIDGSSCQLKEATQPAPVPQPADPNSISILAGRLAKVEGQFGLSKWRTADGEFNKARLASDLTAGVVLGTTGALVTSSVVKKKQVKEGFEALECTIGGQRVGDYGDKFHISGK